MSLTKILRKFISISAVCAVAVAIGSCGGDNVGLGASVDTEAPTIDISYPPALAAIRGTFIFAGTCSDDKEVTSITLTIKNTAHPENVYLSNEVKIEEKHNWSVEVNNYDPENADYINGWQLPDGKYELSVVASDHSGHKSGTSSRTFEIDNTAPVVVLTKPGTTDETIATAYGSSFKVDGTIADEHTIAKMAISIYDEKGTETPINAEPYFEEGIPTAGGTSVTMMKFSTGTDLSDELNTRYRAVYGEDLTGNTKSYWCTIEISDSTHEYVNPSEGENTTVGNSTKTFYLNKDIYDDLLSKKTLELTAADLMTILNGTYEGTNKNVVRTASDENAMTAEKVLKILQDRAVNTEEKKLAFTLNPAANPTYMVSGFQFEKGNSVPAKQPLNVVVSMGLDSVEVLPSTLKAYLKDFGTFNLGEEISVSEYPKEISKTERYKNFIAVIDEEDTYKDAPTLENVKEGDSLVLFADNGEYDSEASTDIYNWVINLPETIMANHWYMVVVRGTDREGYELRRNEDYGFKGTTSGVPPTMEFDDDYKDVVNSLDDILLTGKVSSNETDIAFVSFTTKITDLDTGEVVQWNGSDGGAEGNKAKFTASQAGSHAGSWQISVKDAIEYTGPQPAGKNCRYVFSISGYDKNGNFSQPRDFAVLVDTTKPVVEYTGTKLADGAVITNADTNFEYRNDIYSYRLSGAWSDVNGAGTDVLYYTTDASGIQKNADGTYSVLNEYDAKKTNNVWQIADDFASATVGRTWNVDLPVGQTLDGMIAFYATDKAGNRSVVTAYSGLTFDYDNPVLTKVDEPDASVKFGESIKVSGKLTDTLALVKKESCGITVTAMKVVEKKDGVEDQPFYKLKTGEVKYVEIYPAKAIFKSEDDKNATYSLEIPAIASDGTDNKGDWIITVEAVDAAGLGATKLEYEVTVDGEAPTIELSDESQKQKIFDKTKPQNFEGTMRDNVGVANVYYKVTTENERPAFDKKEWKVAAIENDEATKWSATINFSKDYDEGTPYYVYFAAQDNVGNIGFTNEAVSVLMDNTSPETKLFATGLYAEDGTEIETAEELNGTTYLAKESFTLSGTITEANFKNASITVNGSVQTAPLATASGDWTFNPNVTEDNSYTYVITLEDEAEHTKTYTITVNRDTTGPVVTVGSPAEDEAISDKEANIRGTVTDVYAGAKTVFYKAKEADEWAETKLTGNNWNKELEFETEGAITLQVYAVDALGNKGETVTRKFSYDKGAPTLEETGITENGLTTNATVTVKGTAEDSNALYKNASGKGEIEILDKTGSVIKTIEMTLEEDGKKGTFSGELTVKGETPDLANGTHALTIRVKDAAGRPTSWPRTVKVDTKEPVVSVATAANAIVLQDESPYNTLNVTAGDTGDGATGVKGVYYQVLPSTATKPTYTAENASSWTPLAPTSSAWTASVNFTGKAEGKYQIYAVATDNAGNESAVFAGGTVEVDKQKPVVFSVQNGTTSVSSNDTAKNEKITYTVTVSDTNPVSASVKVAADGTEIETISDNSLSGDKKQASLAVDFSDDTKYPDGTYTLTFTAKDANDRVSEEKTISVLKDSTPPELTITSPEADGFAKVNMLTFAGTAKDENLAGVTAKLFKNGSTTAEKTEEISVDSSDNWTWKVYDLDEAAYNITVTAKDKVGHETNITSKTVTVDTVAPKTTLTGTGLIILAADGTVTELASGATLTSGSTYYAKDSFSFGGDITEANFDNATIGATGDTSASAPTYDSANNKKWTFSPTSLTDGNKTYTITLKDKADNQTSYTITVIRDKTAPALAISGLENNATYTESVVKNGKYAIAGTWSDKDAGTKTLQYTTNKNPSELTAEGTDSTNSWVTITAPVATNVTTNWTLDLPVAESLDNTISFRAKDAIGNVSNVADYTYTGINFDFSIPVITPAETVVSKTKSDVTLTGTVTDAFLLAKSDISITAKKDGGDSTAISATITEAAETAQSYNFSITIPAATNHGNDGTWTITMSAKDKAGRSAETKTQTTLIDTTAPTIASNTMASNHVYKDESVFNALTVAAEENGSGLAGVYYKLATSEPSYSSSESGWTALGQDSSGWKLNIDFSEISEDTYTVYVVAVDEVGNVSSVSEGNSVVVDTKKPVIASVKHGDAEVSANDTVKADDLTYTVAVSDTNPKSASITVTKADGTKLTKKNADGSTTEVEADEISGNADASGKVSLIVPFSSYADGTYALTFNAKDKNERKAVEKTVSVLKDSKDPEVTITSPSEAGFSKLNALTFTGTAKDENLDTVTAELFMNDGTTATKKEEVSVNSETHEWKWKVYDLEEATYSIKVTAEDKAGNTSTADTTDKKMTVDVTEPTTTLTGTNLFTIADGTATEVAEDVTLDSEHTYYAKGLFSFGGTVIDGNFDGETGITVAGGTGTKTLDTSNSKNWTFTPNNLADGSKTYTITFTDKAQNQKSYAVTVIYDTTAPEVKVSSPTENEAISDATMSVRGTATDAYAGTKTVYYKYKLGTGAWVEKDGDNPLTADLTGSNWTKGLSFAAEGTITVEAYAVDALGNAGSWVTRSFSYDQGAPTLTETSIGENGITTNGGAEKVVSLGGTASDTNALKNGGTGAVEVLDKNGFTLASFNVAEDGTWSGTLPIGSGNGELVDGTHNFTVRATDAAGRTSSEPRTVKIDTKTPTISTVAVEELMVAQDESPYDTLSVKATDSGAGATGLAGVYYKVLPSGENTPAYSEDTAATWKSLAQSASAWTANINFTSKDKDLLNGYDEGEYKIYIVAKDNAGNVSAVSALYDTITLDKQKPAISSVNNGTEGVSSNDTAKNEKITYTVTVSDTNPASASVMVTKKNDDGTETVITTDPISADVDGNKQVSLTVPFTEKNSDNSAKYPDGTYTLTFSAKDENGRISETKTVSVLKDSTAPTVTIESVAEFTKDSSYTFKGTADDNNLDTVTAILFKKNGDGEYAKADETTLSPDKNHDWTWKVFDLDLDSDGNKTEENKYKVVVTAKDKVKHETTLESDELAVDTTAPTTTLAGTGILSENGSSVSELESGKTYYAMSSFTLTGTISEANLAESGLTLTTGTGYGEGSVTYDTNDVRNWTFTPTNLTTDGERTYKFGLSDKAGNNTPYTIVVIRDTAAPTITIGENVLKSGTTYKEDVVKNNEYVITGTWSDANAGTKTLQYTTKASPAEGDWETISAPEAKGVTTSWTLRFPVQEESLNNTIKFRAIDAIGNKSDAAYYTYTGINFDTSIPVITVTNEPGKFTNENLSLVGTVSDGLLLSKNDISITAKNGDKTVPASFTEGDDEAKLYNFTVPITSDTLTDIDGEWTITIDAKDKTGRAAEQVVVTTIIDTKDPVVSSLNATSQYYQNIADESVTYFNNKYALDFSFEATDDGSGVKMVEYTAVKGHFDKWTSVTNYETNKVFDWVKDAILGSDGKWTATIKKFTSASEGKYTIFARVTDNVGKQTISDGLKLYADKTDPELNESIGRYISVGTNNTFTLEGTVSDNNWVEVTFSLDAHSAGDNETPTFTPSTGIPGDDGKWTISQKVTNPDEGTHYFTYTITATDKAKNETSVTKTVSIDKNAPALTVTKLNGNALPDSGEIAINTSNSIFEGTASDDLSGIYSITGYVFLKEDVESVSFDTSASLTSTLIAKAKLKTDINLGAGESADSWRATFILPTEDSYIPVFVAVDAAGNKKVVKTNPFSADFKSPESTLNVTNVKEIAGNSAVALDSTKNYGYNSSDNTNGLWNDGVTYYVGNQNGFTLSGEITDAKGFDASGITFTVNGVETDLGLTGTDLTELDWSYTQSYESDKTYTCKLAMQDKAGNPVNTDTFIVKVDTTAPTANITSPAANTNHDGSVTVTGMALDGNGSGVPTVSYTLVRLDKDGTEVASSTNTHTLLVTDNQWRNTFSLDSQSRYRLTITPTDYMGKEGEPKSIVFYYDKTAPVVSAPTVAESMAAGMTYYNTGTITVSAAVEDTISEVSSVYYTVDGGTTKKIMSETKDAQNNPTGTYSGELNLADGTHTIAVYATDAHTNETTGDKVKTITVKIDTTEPKFGTITATTPSKNDITVSGTITENIGLREGGFTVTAKKNNSDVETLPFTAPTFTAGTKLDAEVWSFTLPATTGGNKNDGNWEFTITATDQAGHAVSVTKEVQIDTTAPESMGTIGFATGKGTLSEGVYYFNSKDIPEITITANDSGTGVSTVEFAAVSGHTDEGISSAANNDLAVAWTRLQQGTDSYSLSATQFNDRDEGAYTVFVRATDAVGNIAYSTGYKVYNDRTAPEVEETDGVGTYINLNAENKFALSGTVSDTNYKAIAVTSASASNAGDIVTSDITYVNREWKITQEVNVGAENATHQFTYIITASDKAGNTTPITKTVYIDKTKPTVTVSTLNSTDDTPNITANMTINSQNSIFAGTVTDDLSGVSSMMGYIFAETDAPAANTQTLSADQITKAAVKSGIVVGTGSGADSWSVTFVLPRDGWYVPVFVAKDSAGNEQVTVGSRFGADFEAPVSTLNVTANVKQVVNKQAVALTANKNYGDGADSAEQNRWNDGVTYYVGDQKGFTLSGTITDEFGFAADNITFTVNGVKTGLGLTGENLTTVNWSYAPTYDGDKTYTCKLVMTDKAGNTPRSNTFIVQVDTTQPLVAIVAPTVNSNQTENTIALSGTVVDTGSGVASVTYTIKNKDTSKTTTVDGTATVTGGNWSVGEADISATDLQGTLVLTVKAKDYLGNEKQADSVEFYHDSVAPTVKSASIVEAPTGTVEAQKWYNTSVLSLSATAQDEQSGLAGVTYQVSDGSRTAMTLGTGADTAERAATASSVVMNEGENTIKIIATDKVNNASAVSSQTIYVDTKKPVFGETKVYKTGDNTETSINLTNAAFTIAGTLTELNIAPTNGFTVVAKKDDVTQDISGIITVSSPASASTAQNWSIAVPQTIGDGEWTFTITAKDKAGNTTDTEAKVTVDTTAPAMADYADGKSIMVEGKDIASTWYKANTLTVSGKFTENGSGLSKVFYYVKAPESDNPPTVLYTIADGTVSAAENVGVVTLADLKGTATYTVTPSNFAENGGTNGSTANEVYIQAMDKAGNFSERKGPYTVNIDQNAPDITSAYYSSDDGASLTAASGTVYTNASTDMIIYGSISDALSGINSLAFFVGSSEIAPTSLQYTTGSATSDADYKALTGWESLTAGNEKSYKSWKAVIKGSDLSNGIVYVNVTDKADNSKRQQIFALAVDKDSPTIAVNGTYLSRLVAKSVKINGEIDTTVSDSKDPNAINGTATFAGTATDNYTLTSVDMYYSTSDYSAEIKTDDVKVDPTDGSNAFSWKYIKEVSKLDSATGKVTVLGTETDTTVKPLYVKLRAKDSAGNESIYVYLYNIDPLSDKPTINISNISGNNGTLKYETTITGSIKDDDDIDVTKCELRVYEFSGSASVPEDVSNWESNGTKVTLSQTGEWTYNLKKDTVDGKEIVQDGEKNLYVYFKDAAGTSFWTGYNKGASVAAFQPNVTFKNQKDEYYSEDKKIAFRVDSESPSVTGATALSFMTNADDAVANEKDADGNPKDTGVGSTFVVGGTKKKYARFTLTATDANGIAGMAYTLTGTDTDGNPKTLYYATKAAISGINFTSAGYSIDDKTVEFEGTDATWTTKKIDFSEFATGQLTLVITAYDNSGLKGNGSYYFSVDNTGPSISVTTPRSGEEKTGTITMQGTAIDEGGAGTADIRYFVPTTDQQIASNALDEKGNALLTSAEVLKALTKTITVNNKEQTVSVWGGTLANEDSVSVTYWKFIFAEKDSDNTYLSEYDNATYCGTNIVDGVYTIPLYLMATDELGNYTIKANYTIAHNPDGDRPATAFSYPQQKDYDGYDKDNKTSYGYITLGGTIRLTGGTEIPSMTTTVDSVYYQVAGEQGFNTAQSSADAIEKYGQDAVVSAYQVLNSILGTEYTADTNYSATQLKEYGFASTDELNAWWGIKASGSAAWSIVLNTKGELNPAQGADATNNIIVRACGINANGKFGAWTTGNDGVICVHIDSNAPTIQVAINQYAEDNISTGNETASQLYETNMFLRGQWYLVAEAKDESYLKSVKVKKGTTEIDTSSFVSENTESEGKLTCSKLFIPIDKTVSGTLEYTVSATDGENKTAAQTFSFEIDNTPPTLEELKGNGENIEVIQNKDYIYTLSGKSSDDKGSGVERIVFYYMRKNTDETSIRKELILDPMIDSGYANAKIDMPGSFDSVADGGIDLLTLEQEGSETCYLYAYKVAGASTTETFTPTSATLNNHVRAGGLIYIDGIYRRIKAISDNTVTFEPALSGAKNGVTAWFPIAQVIDNSATEKVANPKTFEFEKGDDGDGMPESFSKSGSTWTWDASIHSDNLPDGPVSLVILAFDNAGNVNGTTKNVTISNNAPRLAKLNLATDLNDNNQFEDNEFVAYDIFKEETTVKENYILNLTTYSAGAFTAKNKLAVVPELVGGNGNVLLVAKKDAVAVKTTDADGKEKEVASAVAKADGTPIYSIVSGTATQADDKTISVTLAKADTDQTSPYSITATNFAVAQAGNNFFAYVLDNATLTGIAAFDTNANTPNANTPGGRDTNETADSAKDETTGKLKADKSFSFTFWDSTDETTQGTSSQKAVVLVNGFTFDLTDGTSPTTVINPFYWNDVETNSVYGSGKNKKADDLQGHIELEKDLNAEIKAATAGDTTLGDDPKVSGKIVFTGTAYDEHSLDSLAFTFAAGDTTPTYNKGSWSGSGSDRTWTNGTWTNATSMANYNPKDAKWENANATIADNYYEVTTSSAGENGVYKDEAYFNQDGHKVYWTLTIDTANLLSDVADKDVKLTVYAADLSGNVTASEIVQPTFDDAKNYKAGTNEGRTVTDGTTNVPVYQMDVVPYITKVYTSLAALKKNNWSVYNRTALGHYPVALNVTWSGSTKTYSGEKIYLYGFNLGSSEKLPTYGTTSLDEPVAGSVTKIGNADTPYPSGTSYAAYQVVTFPVTGTVSSGGIELTVNSMPTLNNLTDKDSKGAYTETTTNVTGDEDIYSNYYNRQPNGDSNNLLTDDVVLDVWEVDPMAVRPINGYATQPVMAINPKNHDVGFAFVNGTLYYSMPNGNSYSYDNWIGGLDFWTGVGLAYDSLGNSYGTASGGDIADNRADTFRIMTSRWGRASYNSTSGYDNGINQYRLEWIAQADYYGSNTAVRNFNKERIRSPSIATTAATTDATTVYLAYYDEINDEIRFKHGKIGAKIKNWYKYAQTANGIASFFGDFYGRPDGSERNPSWNNVSTSDDVEASVWLGKQTLEAHGGWYNLEHNSLIAGQTKDKEYIPYTWNGNNLSAGTRASMSAAVMTDKDQPVYAGKYVSIAAIQGAGDTYNIGTEEAPESFTDDAVVAVWWDAEHTQLLYSYNKRPQAIQVGQYLQSDTKWSTPVAIFGEGNGIGEYCKVVVDQNKGVHIAAYDGLGGDLWYAYISDFSNPDGAKTCIVDSYGIIGTELNIDVALDASGNPIPYISYYAGNCAHPKTAHWVGNTSLASTDKDKMSGADNEQFTGAWEVSVIPTSSRISVDHINIGVWKSTQEDHLGELTYSTTDGNKPSGSNVGQRNAYTTGTNGHGKVWGNGTVNPILGYAITKGSSGYVETAQMR